MTGAMPARWLTAIAACWRACADARHHRWLRLICAWLGCRTGSLQGKEPRPTPGRAGDGAGDRGEAGIGGSLPVEAVADGRDGVALALILANEHGPGFELATWRALVSREALQEPQAVAIKTAKSSLLQPRGNHATQQVLAQTAGGIRPNTSRQCRRSASSRSERMRSISAAIAAGSSPAPRA